MASSSNPTTPEPGQVWEATSGHWIGDVVELQHNTGHAWVVRRISRSAGRRGPAHKEGRNIPNAYFEIHYSFRSAGRRHKGTNRSTKEPEGTIVNPTPPPSLAPAPAAPIPNGTTRAEPQLPLWRVRYRTDVQEIEFAAKTLLDVASEMEQFAPGCEVLSAEKIAS